MTRPEFHVCDARHLDYLADGSIELLLTSPPWDRPSIVKKCREEWSRVLAPNGRIALIWRHNIEVWNRDWECLGLAPAPPQGKMGINYRTTPEWAVWFLLKDDPAETLLDPLCGTGAIPRVAAALGKRAFGSDTDERAIEVAKALPFPPKVPTVLSAG